MTTIANIFILLCLAAAVATANHYRRRWARAEDTNRFLMGKYSQECERLEEALREAQVENMKRDTAVQVAKMWQAECETQKAIAALMQRNDPIGIFTPPAKQDATRATETPHNA